MKKVFFIIALLLTSTNLVSQNTDSTSNASSVTKKYVFQGFEIDGKRKAFCDSLKKKGFTVVETLDEKHMTILTGEMSKKTVKVYVVSTPKSDTVRKIAVFYPNREDWFSLSSDYSQLEKILNSKYGEGKCVELWLSPWTDDHLGNEMVALGSDKLIKYCIWKENNISLEISHFKYEGYCVLKYSNPINEKKAEKEQKEIDDDTY